MIGLIVPSSTHQNPTSLTDSKLEAILKLSDEYMSSVAEKSVGICNLFCIGARHLIIAFFYAPTKITTLSSEFIMVACSGQSNDWSASNTRYCKPATRRLQTICNSLTGDFQLSVLESPK